MLSACTPGCGHASAPDGSRPPTAAAHAQPAPAVFTDAAASAGLRYRWSIPGKRPINILQGIGNGCAFLDYDQDGNLDILLVGPTVALYRGDGHGRFADVSHETGLDRLNGHFLGCAVGDYDNDGYPDVYLTGYRAGVLLHNELASAGASRRCFRDRTAGSGILPQPWGTSAQFFDADRDGNLDLYVGSYVQFGPRSAQLCDYHGVMAGCGPTTYPALRGALYLNAGAGRFRDVTRTWRMDRVAGRTLGVAAAPWRLSGKTLTALAIADDETTSDLMLLNGAHTVDVGVATGMARSGNGVYGGMGVDWGDFDNDGSLDLAIATYQSQGKLVLKNRGGLFTGDGAMSAGLRPEVPLVAFGVKWLDYDNDGWLDLMFANGHVEDNAEQVNFMGFPPGAGYKQPVLLFHNEGGKRLVDSTSGLDGGASRPIVGRGLAIGDYDNDGREDALVADAEGGPVLLHNVARHAGHALLLKLVGSRSNRDGIGALATVIAGGMRQVRLCTTGGSYMSASDPRVHIGIGAATTAHVTVHWPSGLTREYGRVSAGRVIQLRE